MFEPMAPLRIQERHSKPERFFVDVSLCMAPRDLGECSCCMVLLSITYMKKTLTAMSTARACESWGPGAMWPCIQIIREQSRMCNQLLLGPLQTFACLGSSWQAQVLRLKTQVGGSVFRYNFWLCTCRASGEGAHGTGYRRSLRIMEAQGHVPSHTELQVGLPASWRWVRCRLPKRPVEWMLKLLPRPRRSGVSTVRPYTQSLAICHRGKIGPQRPRMSRKLVLGPLQAYSLLGNVQGKCSCQARRPQEEVFSNTPLPLARHDRHPEMATFATRTGAGVSAEITAGARHSRRLQSLPPAMAGRVRRADSVPQNTDEVFSPPCILRGLVDGVNTPLNPQRLCMTMFFHLTGASDCCAGPALAAPTKRVMACKNKLTEGVSRTPSTQQELCMREVVGLFCMLVLLRGLVSNTWLAG